MLGLLFYAKSHITYTHRYFEKINLKVFEIRSPELTHWNKNPFNQKNKTWLGSIFRSPFDLNLIDHKLVIVSDNSNSNFQVYWRQVKSSVFFGGTVTFKKSIPLSPKELEKLMPRIIDVSNKCPACENKIKISHERCESCGINFS